MFEKDDLSVDCGRTAANSFDRHWDCHSKSATQACPK